MDDLIQEIEEALDAGWWWLVRYVPDRQCYFANIGHSNPNLVPAHERIVYPNDGGNSIEALQGSFDKYKAARQSMLQ